MKTMNSVVPGYEGECTPIWVNGNTILNHLVGDEFHGMVVGGEVHPT